MKKQFVIVLPLLMALLLLSGCAGGTVSFVDYTGYSPSGTLGIVKLFADNPDHKGVEVTLRLSGFGDVAGVDDQTDVREVSKALVEHASLYNEENGFTEKQYFYLYSSTEFNAGNTCKITLYYLVPPESANANLCFKYDYADGRIFIDEPCNLFE